MYLLVPVVFEQMIIASSFERFRALLPGRPWLHVIFITTAREMGSQDRRTTHEILEELLAKARNRQLRLLCDHRLVGVMAHQLNYAVDVIKSEEKAPFLIGIYNADSVTSPLAIDYARTRLMDGPSSVLQQYAAYRIPTNGTFSDRIRSHVAAWQTRWSLQFELGRLLMDQGLFRDPCEVGGAFSLVRPFHYVIGHGLFLSSATWRWASGVPDDEINEDAFFGLLLHVHGRRLEPIPYLETAEPPPTLLAYLKQQAVWFNGPLYAFRYASKLLFGSRGRHADRPLVNGLIARTNVGVAALKLSLHAVYWLFGPTLMLIITIWVLASGEWVAAAVWVFLVFYFVYGLNVIAHLLATRLGATTGRLGGPIAGLTAYLLHAVGPILCLARVVSGRNKQEDKYKTERDAVLPS